MASKQRNYKAEYQRRRQLAQQRGLTIAQARGHARKDETKVSELKRSGVIDSTRLPTLKRFYQAIEGIASGKSLTQAAKDAHISAATIKKLNADRHILYRTPDGRHWETRSAAQFPILTKEGKLFQEIPLDRKNANLVGLYWNATQKAYLGDASALNSFIHITVFDMHGNDYQLLTSVDDLISIFDQINEADREGYERSFASDQRAFRVLNHAA
ncbi:MULTISPECIES: hypothetical protein [Nitrosomonas]|uniref:Uncharacterized protein n=1 Tax=Nitrosomonas communis TaxID=44574 RepID=A0A0F7KHV8_9PROT|nr:MULTISPECIES: hypothetical protein [Nitrosomonas]AKH38462.1 hypothetical protein AAW31_12720 [Nitrosomonas communis]TYP87780.1 hypothetical protein BCL69_102312 [Nitrosomonas communis]UVS60494.1 hypothetical protein NX761_13390 [Nitrosomonas sp. PLL12]